MRAAACCSQTLRLRFERTPRCDFRPAHYLHGKMRRGRLRAPAAGIKTPARLPPLSPCAIARRVASLFFSLRRLYFINLAMAKKICTYWTYGRLPCSADLSMACVAGSARGSLLAFLTLYALLSADSGSLSCASSAAARTALGRGKRRAGAAPRDIRYSIPLAP